MKKAWKKLGKITSGSKSSKKEAKYAAQKLLSEKMTYKDVSNASLPCTDAFFSLHVAA